VASRDRRDGGPRDAGAGTWRYNRIFHRAGPITRRDWCRPRRRSWNRWRPIRFATLYGTNLSFETHAAGVSDLSGGNLPIVLEGVSVFVNFLPVPMLFVHPRRLTS